MNRTSKALVLLAGLFLATTATAQQDREMAEEERRVLVEKEKAEIRVKLEQEKAATRQEMVEAERRLAEAARRIAELSQQNLPRVAEGIQFLSSDNRPRLGVTISGSDASGPVEGVLVAGVTPGGAAAENGIEAGDVLTAVNDESLSAENGAMANEKLLAFMQGVELGDKLKVEYLRDGKVGSVELEPTTVTSNVFAWSGQDGADVRVFGSSPDFDVHVAPEVGNAFRYEFAFPFAGRSWGSLEIIELNEGLGRYFGTDSGLLVVSAPEDSDLQLQDGDVIKSIDGREPNSVGHAMRILGSYQPGEELKLNIMRDKRKKTLTIEMPDDRRSYLRVPPSSMVAPLAPAAPTPANAPVVIVPDAPETPVVIMETRT